LRSRPALRSSGRAGALKSRLKRFCFLLGNPMWIDIASRIEIRDGKHSAPDVKLLNSVIPSGAKRPGRSFREVEGPCVRREWQCSVSRDAAKRRVPPLRCSPTKSASVLGRDDNVQSSLQAVSCFAPSGLVVRPEHPYTVLVCRQCSLLPLLEHLGDVHLETCLRQQRCQFEHFVAVA
jgi:hypothetical protein